MTALYDYSKWDKLDVSDTSDDGDYKIQPRRQHLIANHIVPFDQTFEYRSDSFTADSDFEYSRKSTASIHALDVEAFAAMQFRNEMDTDARMKAYEEDQKIKKLELLRLNELHSKFISNSNKVLQSDFVLRIYLEGIRPRIWRQIRVPSTMSLAAFHDKCLTPLFRWKRNFHSYLFLKQQRKDKRISYGILGLNASDNGHVGFQGSRFYKMGSIVVNSHHVFLCDVLDDNTKSLRYVYDLGDQFWHKITLEQILPRQKRKNIVRVLDGKRGHPLENTKGNRGFVERLNKMHDTKISDSDFENAFYDIINAPNFGCQATTNFYNVQSFDRHSVQRNVNKHVRSILTTQDAVCMTRYPYGKYALDEEAFLAYKHGQDYADSKEWAEIMRGFRECAWCNVTDKKFSGQPREKIFKACKGCLSAFYCSRSCQKRDWKVMHRFYCFGIC